MLEKCLKLTTTVNGGGSKATNHFCTYITIETNAHHTDV